MQLWGSPLAPVPPSSHYYALRLARAEDREPLTALAIFQGEAGRIPTVVSDPAVGRAKAHWWRSELARMTGGGGDHPVARVLCDRLQSGALPLSDLRPVLDAVDDDLDGGAFADATDLLTYGAQLGGATYRAAARVLLAEATPALRWAESTGTAVALTGRLRMFGHHARHGRIYLPGTLLHAEGLDTDTALALATGAQWEGLEALHAALREQAEVLERVFAEAESERPAGRGRKALRPLIAHAALYRAVLGRIRRIGAEQVLRGHTHLTPLKKLWCAHRAK